MKEINNDNEIHKIIDTGIFNNNTHSYMEAVISSIISWQIISDMRREIKADTNKFSGTSIHKHYQT